MFFIVNKTKQTIVLGDIKVTLGPRQAIDLDKIMKRSKSDSSKHLKRTISKGVVEVRHKDQRRNRSTEPVAQVPNLDGFKAELINELKGTLREMMLGQPQVSSTGNVSKEDLETIIRKSISLLPQPETVIIHRDKVSQDEEVEMDEEILADIGARAVDKMVEGVEMKSINYKEKQAENTILHNVDELEGLLG